MRKLKSILTDCGFQFNSTESEKSKGVSEFEKHLESLDIRHIFARGPELWQCSGAITAPLSCITLTIRLAKN